MDVQNGTGAADVRVINLRADRRLVWSPPTGAVIIDGSPVSKSDAAILVSLLRQQPGEVVETKALLGEHYPGRSDPDPLYSRVKHLRARLRAGVVDTAMGVGYRIAVADAEAFGPTFHVEIGSARYYRRRRGLGGPLGEVELTPREDLLARVLIDLGGMTATTAEMMRASGITRPVRFRETSDGLLRKFRRVGAAKVLVAADGRWALEMEGVVRVGPLELHPATETARMHGQPVYLGMGWFQVLERLARCPGSVVSPWELVLAWTGKRPDIRMSDEAADQMLDDLDAEVRLIQAALGPDGPHLVVGGGEGCYYLNIHRFGLRAVGTLLLDARAERARNWVRSEWVSPRDCGIHEEFARAKDNVVPRHRLVKVAGLRPGQTLYGALKPVRRQLQRLCDLQDDQPVIVYDSHKRVYRLARERFGVL